jgi:hypothetical protein
VGRDSSGAAALPLVESRSSVKRGCRRSAADRCVREVDRPRPARGWAEFGLWTAREFVNQRRASLRVTDVWTHEKNAVTMFCDSRPVSPSPVRASVVAAHFRRRESESVMRQPIVAGVRPQQCSDRREAREWICASSLEARRPVRCRLICLCQSDLTRTSLEVSTIGPILDGILLISIGAGVCAK